MALHPQVQSILDEQISKASLDKLPFEFQKVKKAVITIQLIQDYEMTEDKRNDLLNHVVDSLNGVSQGVGAAYGSKFGVSNFLKNIFSGYTDETVANVLEGQAQRRSDETTDAEFLTVLAGMEFYPGPFAHLKDSAFEIAQNHITKRLEKLIPLLFSRITSAQHHNCVTQMEHSARSECEQTLKASRQRLLSEVQAISAALTSASV